MSSAHERGDSFYDICPVGDLEHVRAEPVRAFPCDDYGRFGLVLRARGTAARPPDDDSAPGFVVPAGGTVNRVVVVVRVLVAAAAVGARGIGVSEMVKVVVARVSEVQGSGPTWGSGGRIAAAAAEGRHISGPPPVRHLTEIRKLCR